jgi:Transglycosylase SLT domain/SPOR domain
MQLGLPFAVFALLLAAGGPVRAAQEQAPAAGTSETVEQALCRLIEGSARTHKLPVSFFTRLIWRESSFRTGVVSPKGAQGVAQFMPRTAEERRLADPFDPEQAIPASASFLADLKERFGNLGLAAAAYNGGPTRVGNWLEGGGELPSETRAYVFAITGRTVDDWREDAKGTGEEPERPAPASLSCLQVTASLRRGPGRIMPDMPEAPFAPWGVQLAGNFSKALALASFARARQSYARVLPDVRPMVIGTRLRSRGLRTYYRIRVPAQTREAADTLCNRIRSVGGACVVLRS